MSSIVMPPTETAHVSGSVPCATGRVDFLAIYDDYAPFVWRTLRRLGVSAEGLDDAVQDVFVVVHRQLPHFEFRSQIRTWLFGIVLRVAGAHRRQLKRKGLQPEAVVDADTVSDPHERGPAQSAEEAEELRLLQGFLEQLNDDRRVILCLVDLEQLSVPEAAEMLGINVNTTYTRLRAARQDFQRVVLNYEKASSRGRRAKEGAS